MRRWIAFMLALLALVTLNAAFAEEEQEQAEELLTSFDCEDLDGNPVDITLFDGAELVLIDCWEAWCPWCLKEMPDLNELYELNKDRGFLIVGLSGINTVPGYDTKQTAEGMNITYPLVNGTEELLPFSLNGFPTTYVYQRQEDGTLQYVCFIEGYMPREEWNAFLKEYMPEAVTEAGTEET